MSMTIRTRAYSVADILRERIESGEIAADTHLMEIPLAKQLGVSRTPVHDALTRLAEEGLVLANPNRGFVVRRFGPKDVFDSMTLRATLEGLGCKLVGERGLTIQAHELLSTLLDQQHKALHGEQWNQESVVLWQDLNLDFHYALLDLADNPWLTDAVRRSRKLPPIYAGISRPHDLLAIRMLYRREHSLEALEDHRRIVEALVRREVARAEALMREHVLTNRDQLMRRLTAEPSESAQLGQTTTSRSTAAASMP